VADLLQFGTTADNQAWMTQLVNLNMTDAAAFNDLAVQGSVSIQKDLHVGGVIYAAELNADTVRAKEKLCVGQTCLTEGELKALLQLLPQGQPPASPESQPDIPPQSAAADSPPAATATPASSPAPPVEPSVEPPDASASEPSSTAVVLDAVTSQSTGTSSEASAGEVSAGQ
jgi:hypothetical protein